ncbi:hypothetical protein DFS34DRAFT_638989 [Phlyctochytrium arcticum]|nr:hypothetical protein DFS34DRAFT_638989 [Phlyctochytrium arcticum]
MGRDPNHKPSRSSNKPSAAVWASSQAIGAACLMFNGGLYGFIRPYATIAYLIDRPIPAAFFFPFSYPSLIAFLFFPIIFFVETECTASAKSINASLGYAPKVLIYTILGFATLGQLTLVPAATFLFLTAFTNLVAAFSSNSDPSLTGFPSSAPIKS